MDTLLTEARIREAFPDITALNQMQRAAIDCPDTRSMILLAPTGTGKTLAFTCAMMRNLTPPAGHVQAVILTPSRELTVQVAEVVRKVTAPQGWKTVALYGGHRMADEVNSLGVVPDIVVATPGRLLDHITKDNIDVGRASVLIIDEYDKCLELGFEQEMRRIAKRILRPQRIILTSATPLESLPQYLPTASKPMTLDFTAPGDSTTKVAIVEIESPGRDKLDTLIDLLNGLDNGKAIVFVNHREAAERIHGRLRREGLPAGLYHGALDQPARLDAVELLENGTTPILVSTDLGARGLDISQVDNVIHYHLPVNEAAWIHRNGRTARQGAKGTVYYIVSEADDRPEYIRADRTLIPSGKTAANPITALNATLKLQKGRKDKISRADILGYLTGPGALEGEDVGHIALRDHHSLVAVPVTKAGRVLTNLAGAPLKGKSVKVSVIRG